MELQHVIPAHRISHKYLCGLMRGHGKSKPVICALQNARSQNLVERFRIGAQALAELAIICVKGVMVDLVKSGRVGARTRVGLCHAIGFVEGAWQFLREGGALKLERRIEQSNDAA